MAQFVISVRTFKGVTEVFDYMADLRNFAEWDPGVSKVAQVVGDGGGVASSFDVDVKGVGKDLTLRYETTRYEPPTVVVARAESSMFTSLDRIEVVADGAGSIVTYDAQLTLNGPLGIADPLLGLVFKRIGGRAAKGLVQVLDGEVV
jgi:carbon monoxide dehydrogenase subunit G